MAYYYVKTPKISKQEFAQKAEAILSLHPEYNPVSISGKDICVTWWGKAWCQNLERYGDWSYKLAPGRRYVREGAVVDLKINGGEIKGIVLGSRPQPYDVTIKIKAISSERQREIERLISVQNLEDISSGNMPEELREVFVELFPKPDEIDFECSCPDWAYICKHVAAVLYGIGAILDTNPLYLFEMRGINNIIGNILKEKIDKMFENINNDSSRVLTDNDVSELFSMPVDTKMLPESNQTTSPDNTTDDTISAAETEQNQDKTSDKNKIASAFTPEEAKAILKRAEEIGFEKAAREANTTVGMLYLLRNDLYSEEKWNGSFGVDNISTEERYELVDFAKKVGISRAAREARVSMSTLSRWMVEYSKDEPKYWHGNTGVDNLTDEDWRALVDLSQNVSISQLAKEAKVKLPTMYQKIKEYQESAHENVPTTVNTPRLSKDFTPKEIAALLKRVKEIGFENAATEANTTLGVVKWLMYKNKKEEVWHGKIGLENFTDEKEIREIVEFARENGYASAARQAKLTKSILHSWNFRLKKGLPIVLSEKKAPAKKNDTPTTSAKGKPMQLELQWPTEDKENNNVVAQPVQINATQAKVESEQPKQDWLKIVEELRVENAVLKEKLATVTAQNEKMKTALGALL